MTDTATHVLTDQGVPIGWSIIADHPEMAYLADPKGSRPATVAELAATEAAAYQEYAAAMAANAAIGTAPRGPWPVARAAVTAPEAAAEPEPQPEAAEDPAPAPGPIAQMAAETNGLGELDKAQEAKFTAFSASFTEDPAGEGDRAQPDATAVLPAVDAASTETVPAVTEESA